MSVEVEKEEDALGNEIIRYKVREQTRLFLAASNTTNAHNSMSREKERHIQRARSHPLCQYPKYMNSKRTLGEVYHLAHILADRQRYNTEDSLTTNYKKKT